MTASPFDDALAGILPSWAAELASLTDNEAEAWDERVERIRLGCATDDDKRIHGEAMQAMRSGRPIPDAARFFPSEPPNPMPLAVIESGGADGVPRERTSELERAVLLGVPPRIAGRIVSGEVGDTPATRACVAVTRGECMLMVMSGSRGCGKSFAVADWVWRVPQLLPPAPKHLRVTSRRMIDVDALADVAFPDRPKLHLSRALVVDDAGVEKPFLVDEWAAIFIGRYRNALPTIITTNLIESDFNARYGARFADRMHEDGRFVVVGNSDEDSLRRR